MINRVSEGTSGKGCACFHSQMSRFMDSTMKQTAVIFFILSVGFVHSQDIPRTIQLEPYFHYMKIEKGKVLAGYYVEEFDKNASRGLWSSHTFYVGQDRKLQRQVTLEIAFDANFSLISYKRTVEKTGTDPVWYKGEVKGEDLSLTNSRGVKEVLKLPAGVIPENLIRLHFLTQKDRSSEYSGISLLDGTIIPWQVEVSARETSRKDLGPKIVTEETENPEDTKEKAAPAPELGVLVIALTKKIKDKPQKQICRIATRGPNVPNCGALLEIKTDEEYYSWMHRDEYSAVYRGLFPYKPQDSRPERLQRLQEETARLLDPDPTTRYRAVQEIGRIGLWQGVPALIEMLQDEDEKIRNSAYHHLKKITRRSTRPDIGLWRSWWITREELQKRRDAARQAEQEGGE